MYLVAYLDALVIKVRDKSGVRNKSVYIAVGVRPDGSKDVLGLWIEAVEAAFPNAIFQTCIVHMIRSSTRFVPWKDRNAVCADLKTGYTRPKAPRPPRKPWTPSNTNGPTDSRW